MSFPSARSISAPILRETLGRRRGSRRRGHGWGRRRSPKQSGRRKEMKRVAEKLEALKRLIPSPLRSYGGGGGGGGGGAVEAETELLLEEAAGYIERLRSQVQILKHLVDFYGAGEGNAAGEEVEEE